MVDVLTKQPDMQLMGSQLMKLMGQAPILNDFFEKQNEY
jgi:hypothetical protein